MAEGDSVDGVAEVEAPGGRSRRPGRGRGRCVGAGEEGVGAGPLPVRVKVSWPVRSQPVRKTSASELRWTYSRGTVVVSWRASLQRIHGCSVPGRGRTGACFPIVSMVMTSPAEPFDGWDGLRSRDANTYSPVLFARAQPGRMRPARRPAARRAPPGGLSGPGPADIRQVRPQGRAHHRPSGNRGSGHMRRSDRVRAPSVHQARARATSGDRCGGPGPKTIGMRVGSCQTRGRR